MKTSNSTSGLTRRQLAGALYAGAAIAQTPAAAPPAAPSTPATELQAAREQNQRNGESLAKVKIPIDTQPAFRFTA